MTYDAQGNPTSYLGHTLTWEKGRQLKKFDGNIYTYNANGIRTSKIINGVKRAYTLDGTKILRETWGNNTLIPLYDNEDSVCGIVYNDEPLYFQKNLQGDVIALISKDTKPVARYTYDAWGVCTVTMDVLGVANVNPYRYRGYYFDSETGFYYVSSRYYDSEIGRFISPDTTDILTATPMGLTDKNLYAYCDNNPVMREDKGGQFWNFVIGAAVGALVGGVSAAISSYKSSGSVNWGSVAIGATSGAIGGLVGASGICVVGQAAISGVTSALSNVGNSLIQGEKINWTDVAIDAAIGAGTSLIGSALTSKASKAATNTVKKGIDKIVTGKTNYDNGSRYWKGAVKKGFRIMREGLYQLNVAGGKSSIIGSTAGGVLSNGKTLFV